MPVWKPHRLATNVPEGLDLKIHTKVVAATDLPRVPAGTPGKVTVANGLQWKRYWVRFENGVEHGHLDSRHIALP